MVVSKRQCGELGPFMEGGGLQKVKMALHSKLIVEAGESRWPQDKVSKS